MKAFFKYSVVLLTLLSYHCCKENKRLKPEDKVVISFKKEAVLHIKKADSDSVIKTLDIEIADNDYEIQTGLMYRDKLETNHGMLFILDREELQNFYMKNTRIPLDIIYLDANKTIVSFQKNAKPFDETSLPSNTPAKYVLEVNGGLSDVWQLDIGDQISFDKLN